MNCARTRSSTLSHRRRSVPGWMALAALGAWAIAAPLLAPAQQGLERDAQGWTVFIPSDDSRLIYVSSSDGDDATAQVYDDDDAAIGSDPFHPVGPINAYASIAAAQVQQRAGYPDWVLLQRGGVWYESKVKLKSGRSASERYLVGAYGDGPRPLVKCGAERGCNPENSMQFTALVGIDFYGHTRDPNSPEYVSPDGGSGLSWVIHTNSDGISFLVEDCAFRFKSVNWQKNYPGGTVRDLVFRRNLILDTYSGDNSHSMGMFAAHLSDTLLEENIIDHCGWLIQGDGGTNGDGGKATIYNHDTYFSECSDVTFRGNMFLRGSSMGNKWRSDYTSGSINVVLDNNLYVEGELGIGIGGNTNDPFRFINPQITSNVIMHCGRTQPTGRALGWNLSLADWDGGLVANNIILRQDNPAVTNVYGIKINDDSTRNVIVRDNIIYDVRGASGNSLLILGNAAGGITLTGNILQSPVAPMYLVETGSLAGYTFSNNTYHTPKAAYQWFSIAGASRDFYDWQAASGETSATQELVTFVDPTRTVETYNQSQGFAPTMESFVEQVRMQGRHNWRTEYTAAAVNDYIRAGFARAPASPPLLQRFPTGDTYTKQSESGVPPHGAEQNMRTFTSSDIAYSYVKFPIADLAGRQVVQAALRLYANETQTSVLTLRDFPTAWDEETMTQDNLPAPPNAGALVATLDATNLGWYEVDVTTTTLAAVSGGQTEISFSLSANGGNRTWHTKENPSTNAPQLIVTYNRAPAFAAHPFAKPDATEEQPYSATLAADATDPDLGDSLTFTKTAGPDWLAIAADGALTGTPPAGAAGTHTFGVRVEDAHGLTAGASFAILVKPKVPVGISGWAIY